METHLQILPPESKKTDEHLLFPPLPPPPPPPPLMKEKRIRRRGREVSSRYMTASPSSSTPASPIHCSSTVASSSPKFPTFPHPFSTSTRAHFQNLKPHRSSSVPSSPDATDSESESSSRYADENQQGLETPLPVEVHGRGPAIQRRRAVRLFADNGGDIYQMQIVEQGKGTTNASCKMGRKRLGTPMASDHGVVTQRPVFVSQNHMRSVKKTETEESKSQPVTPFPSFKDGGYSDNSTYADIAADPVSFTGLGGLCSSPQIRNQGSYRQWKASEIRSSLPEADLLPISSTKKQTEIEELTCRRSLNSALLSSQPNPFNLLKTVNRKTTVPQSPNIGRLCFPIQHPSSKLGLDLKKGKKGSNKHEEHILYLLQNQYVQWRFVNAKAKVAMKARTITAEKALNEVSDKIEDLRNSVADKRIELAMLRRMTSLSSILDAQMPYLEEWPLVDGEYSASLSGATKALKDAAIRLPITGDLKVDLWELKEAIDSTTIMFESFSPSIEDFLPNAQGIETLISELAKVAIRERALIEECGDLLTEVQAMQVKECSLRSMLLQTKRGNIIRSKKYNSFVLSL